MPAGSQHAAARLGAGPRAVTAHETVSGRVLTDTDLDALAEEVETSDYDLEALRKRRRGGRPAMGSGPAVVVPVRLSPELRAAVDARAQADGTSLSETIRTALRHFLDIDQPVPAQHR